MSLACIFFLTDVNASEGGPCKDYGECDKFKYSLNDMESLQSGASTFMNYCYGCHSLQYSRWGRVATDLQIPEEIFFNTLVFDKSIKPGDLMTGSMSKDSSVEWFGVAPPDLTLVSRVRGDDWIYSYLRAYYEDSSKQYGVNNLVYPGTAMPNVLMALQGSQKLIVFAGLVGCYRGLTVKGGPKGVGDAVNETVVYSFICLFVINVVMTAIGVRVLVKH